MTEKVYKPVYPGLYYFDTFTFTTMGTSGHRGPESTMRYSNAPWRDGDFSIVDGQQQWTVPATGTYRITAAGAYGATPGRVVSGDVNLNEGQVVSLLVGQQPKPLTANVVDATTVGGGGGTFVASGGTLLMVASGGDGTGGNSASFSPYGSGNGQNGGGYLSNGLVTSETFRFLKPEAYVNGGFGNSFPTGVVPEEGGFGGGQSPVTSGISGGGGYTGSPGDGVSGATCYGAGTITDLGAASNSVGYVTVSLIDPAPITQTWSWDKTSQSSASNGPYRTLQWSSELNTFLSMSGSSTDGLTWSGSPYITPQTQTLMFVAYSPTLKIYVGILRKPNQLTTFLANSVDGITWNPLFDISSAQTATSGIIWSVELSRFVVLELLKIWYSDNGIDWNVAYTGGTLIGLSYAASINTFVVTKYPLPLYSTDGINWNEATSDSGSNAWKGVAWSPELNKFIIVSATPGGPTILYSSDGQTWTNDGVDAPPEIRWSVVVWSDFGIFSVIGPSGYSMYSSDGIHWTVLRIRIQSPDSIAYSPSLKFFVCVTGNSFFISIDGKFWIPKNLYGTNAGAWSPELGLFVTYNGFTSNNGITWIAPLQTTNFIQITWISILGLFIGVSSSRYYYSYDGITWTQSSYIGVVSRFAWAPEKGIIAGTAYSRDGITWFDSFSGTGDANFSSGWSKELGIFTGVATNSSYYSYDGINWTQGIFSSTFFPTSTITWSPLRSMFICGGVSGFQSSYVYSMDGLNWELVIFITSLPTWINELSLFVSGTYTSIDGLNWVKLPSQLNCSNMWSPEFGRLITSGGYSQATKTF